MFVRKLFAVDMSALTTLDNGAGGDERTGGGFLLFVFGLYFLRFIFSVFLFRDEEIRFHGQLFRDFPTVIASVFPVVTSKQSDDRREGGNDASDPRAVLLFGGGLGPIQATREAGLLFFKCRLVLPRRLRNYFVVTVHRRSVRS